MCSDAHTQCVSKQFAKLECKLRPDLFFISYCILCDVFLRILLDKRNKHMY